jgi:hypothetical protein
MTIHNKRRKHARSLLAGGIIALAILLPAATAAAENDGSSTRDRAERGQEAPHGQRGALRRARAATAAYRDVDTAHAAGYTLLKDAAGIACIDKPGVGAMGIHYVNGALVDDPAVKASTPEALVYEPQPDGQLRLVALEYVVLQSAWEHAGNEDPPSLFGQEFELVPSGNRYGLPPFYELHAWVWKDNPSGTFNDWNPEVSCAAVD